MDGLPFRRENESLARRIKLDCPNVSEDCFRLLFLGRLTDDRLACICESRRDIQLYPHPVIRPTHPEPVALLIRLHIALLEMLAGLPEARFGHARRGPDAHSNVGSGVEPFSIKCRGEVVSGIMTAGE